jgi:hypothetical protein
MILCIKIVFVSLIINYPQHNALCTEYYYAEYPILFYVLLLYNILECYTKCCYAECCGAKGNNVHRGGGKLMYLVSATFCRH